MQNKKLHNSAQKTLPRITFPLLSLQGKKGFRKKERAEKKGLVPVGLVWARKALISHRTELILG
jgi:hypothetical protein